MNSKAMISLEDLSQILEATEISHSHEEYILAATKNLSSSLEILEGPKFPELQKYFPCQSTKEAEKLGTEHSSIIQSDSAVYRNFSQV